jgi:acyl-CoA thioesterase-1
MSLSVAPASVVPAAHRLASGGTAAGGRPADPASAGSGAGRARPTAPRGTARRAALRLAALAGASALVSAMPGGGARAAEPARRLLVVGDSLSAEYGLPRGSGWVALLARRIDERKLGVEVVNASISGETSSGGRTRLPDLLARHRPAYVLIELGGNDALRGLPMGGTESNLREMVRAAKQAGARPLLLGMQMPPNYGRAYGEQFAAVFTRIAETERVPLVPFFLEGFGDKAEFFQPDRIHPSEKAQPLMLDNVWPTLSKLLAAR